MPGRSVGASALAQSGIRRRAVRPVRPAEVADDASRVITMTTSIVLGQLLDAVAGEAMSPRVRG
jgi:hypothetical protein